MIYLYIYNRSKKRSATIESVETNPMSSAQRHYVNHMKCVRKYQQTHVDQTRAKCAKWFATMKAERPDQYREILDKKKQYYNEITKPKRLQQKLEKESVK